MGGGAMPEGMCSRIILRCAAKNGENPLHWHIRIRAWCALVYQHRKKDTGLKGAGTVLASSFILEYS